MDQSYYSVLEKVKQVFTPDSVEIEKVQKRLQQFNKQELRNLDKNFHTFGVEEVLKCIVEAKGGTHKNEENDA